MVRRLPKPRWRSMRSQDRKRNALRRRLTGDSGRRSFERLEARLALSFVPMPPVSAPDFPQTQLPQTPGLAAAFPDGLKHASPAARMAIAAVTTARSTAPVFPAEAVVGGTSPAIFPQTAQSNTLINLDDFRADARFSGIDGSGFATVILDSGIDRNHPFFGPDSNADGIADRIVYSYDFADNDGNASDVDGHGSNVSSIVASSDATHTGMAPGADIIHLKVFSDAGGGNFGMIEQALQWVIGNAATYNIASVNMSLSDSSNHTSAQQLYGIGDELAALAALDVIVVSASGNSFYSFNSQPGVGYPAADPNSLSVGAVYDSSGGGFSYSSGAIAYTRDAGHVTPFSQRHNALTTIMAPGAPITGANENGGTVTQHGTSQASPHIAGIAVLAQDLAEEVLGRRLTPAEFTALLRSSATSINDGDNEDDNVVNTNLNFPLVDVHRLGEAILALQPTATGIWTPLGPFAATNGQVENVTPNDEVVGALHTVLAHPTNADVLYVGGTNGGVWKTTNATAVRPTWTPLTDAMPAQSIGAMTFDRADATFQTIYAGVGRYSSFGRIGGDRIGLLRSTDGGASWQVVDGGGTLKGKNISGVVANGDTIVVSVNNADSYTYGNIGIFRSTDGGATFQQMTRGDAAYGLPGGVSYDLVADPVDPSVLYTSTTFSAGLNSGQVGIYKSVNDGGTWSKISNATMDALIDNNTTNRTGTSNIEIAVGRANNVYVAIINTGRLEGLFRSGDGGSSWTQLETPSTNEGGTEVGLHPGGGKGPGPEADPAEIAGGQGAIHFSLLADPNHPNIVYVGGDRQPLNQYPNSIGATDYSGRLFRGDASQPVGSQWAHLTHSNALGAAGGGTASNSAPHADSREMVFDANGNIIEVDDGGIYRRTAPLSDQGDWFSVIGDLQITEVHDIAYDAVSNIAITGNQDTGTTQQPTAGALIWNSISTADGGDVVVDDVSLASSGRSIRYSSFQSLGSFRRRTYDASGNLLSTATPALTVINGGQPLDNAFRTPVELNALNPSRLVFQASNGVYESADKGETLVQVPVPLGVSSGNGGIDQNAIVAGGFSGGVANEELLWVGSGSQVLLRTVAGGSLAPTAATAPVDARVRDIAADPDDWRSVVVVDDDQVVMSSNAGASWSDITGNLLAQASELRSISYIASAAIDALVAGTNLGVFVSAIDALGVWLPLADALPKSLVYDMEYDAQDDVLVAGTLGRGAWKLADASQVVGSTFGTTLSVSATDATKREGHSGSTNLTFTVTRIGATSGTTTVDYVVTGNGASPADAADFGGALPSGTVSFAAGELSQTITIAVSGDALVEPDEQFTVTLANASGGATVAAATATGTVLNDDSALSLAATDAVRSEGQNGTTPFAFVVTRSGDLSTTASVAYAVTGTGTSPADASDFGGTLPSGSVSFAAGEASRSITINVAGDVLVEPDEQFTVSLSNPSLGATIFTGSATGVILDDDHNLSIAADDAMRAEGHTGSTAFTFIVTRSGTTVGTATVDYAVTGSGNSPADAADFGGTLPSGTISFADGDAFKTITVNVSGDALVEADEPFTVTLSNASGSTPIGNATAVGLIINDDSGLVLTADNASRNEGNSGSTPFTFTVTRTGDASAAASVDYAVTSTGSNAADAADFGGTLPSGTVSFAAGESSKTISIGVRGDALIETDEQFTVTLSNPSPGLPIETGSAIGTILNDDAALAVAAADATRAEGNSGVTPFTFTVTRTGDTRGGVTVDYAVTSTGSNAADATDFGGTLPSGSISFAAGQTTQTITVNVQGDTNPEPDEAFTVTLANATAGAVIAVPAAEGSILADDVGLVLTATDAAHAEGHTGSTPFTFTVTRIGDSTSAVTVDYAVTGSGNQPADANDFGGTLPAGTISFAAGEVTNSVSINVAGDTAVEADEQFTVTLANASAGVVISGASAAGIIRNDDAALAIAATDAVRAEGTSGTTPFTFTVTRTGDTSSSATVDYAVTGTGSSPADAADFGGTLPSGTLNFAAGEANKLVNIEVAGDAAVEPHEQFSVSLSNASAGATITAATAAGTINNDDAALKISAVIPTASEGGLHAFRIERLGVASGTVSVEYAVSGSGTAAADAADFGGAFPTGTVTFLAGQTAKTVSFAASADGDVEPDEAFAVTLLNPSPAVPITTAADTGTILNDDTATVQYAPLDVNRDSRVDASTDGNLIQVVLFGLADGNMAPFRGSTTLTAAEIRQIIEPLRDNLTLDVNSDGRVDASTDGNLIQVVLFGLADANMNPFRGTTALSNQQIRQQVDALTRIPASDLSGNAAGGATDDDHVTHVDVPLGMYTSEEIAQLESVMPDSSLSTKTPPALIDGAHEDNILTFVLDFKESWQPNTSDIFGNVISTFDAVAYGFSASDIATIADAVLSTVDFDYFGISQGSTAIPTGQDLRVDFVIGDIGTPPPGVTEYYYVQIGTGISGTHSGGTLGVAGGSVVRNRFGSGPNSGIRIGDVVSSVFTDAINTLGGLSPSNALTSGNLNATVHAIAGTTSHEIGHTLSLNHIDKAGVVTPTGLPPVMGTGAIDLPNNDRIHDREFSISGQNSQNNGVTQTHIQQLVDAVGTHAATGGSTSTLSITATNASRREGNSGSTAFSFTVTRTGDLTVAATVAYAVAGSSSNPANAADFGGTLPSGTLSFAAGETSKTLTVNVTGDVVVEPDEQFTVTLSNPTGNASIQSGSAIGTILTDDAVLVLQADQAVASEGNSTGASLTFVVNRSGDVSGSVSVRYTVSGNGTSPADGLDFLGAVLPSGTISLAAGVISHAITIPVNGDLLVESDESFTVTLSNAVGNASISAGSASGTILNDDARISITASDAIRDEGHAGSAAFVFNVTRTGYTGSAGTVDYVVTGSGTHAADAADFGGTLPSGTVSFAAGESSKTVTINVSGDALVESDEQFTVTLSNPSGGALVEIPSAAGTMLNDDAALSIAAFDAVRKEGHTGTTSFTFSVTRTGDTRGAVTVDYLLPGSGPNAADAADFGGTLPSGSVSFAAGQATQTISIGVTGDHQPEPDESFTVALSNAPIGTTIDVPSATGTIVNDDSALHIAATLAFRAEGHTGSTPFTFTVTRTGDTSSAVTVDYTVAGSGNSPADAADFGGTLPAGTLNFAVGDLTKIVSINVAGDATVEADEPFTVTLTNPMAGAVITGASAAGTIRNDDAALAVAATDAVRAEGNSGTMTPFTFTVTRTGDTSATATVDYIVTGAGTWPADVADFGGAFPSGTVSFAAGEATKQISIDVSGDVSLESHEQFSVTLSNPSGGVTISTATADGTINNDDVALKISAAIAAASEGSLHAFRIERLGDASGSVSVDYAVSGSDTAAADAADFGGTFPSGTVTFLAGQTAKTISFAATADGDVEPDEGFTVSLLNASPDVQIDTATASGTILNDDVPTLRFAPLDVNRDSRVDASTDGNLIQVVLFGLADSNMTPFIGSSTLTAAEIRQAIEPLRDDLTLDINGDGRVDASTDGNLIQVVLFGLADANMNPFRGTTTLTNQQIRQKVVDLSAVPTSDLDLPTQPNDSRSNRSDDGSDAFLPHLGPLVRFQPDSLARSFARHYAMPARSIATQPAAPGRPLRSSVSPAVDTSTAYQATDLYFEQLGHESISTHLHATSDDAAEASFSRRLVVSKSALSVNKSRR